MGNERLLTQIKQGDQQAFKVFFDRHYPSLCTYLRSFTPDMDSAQELAQAAFVDFWNKRNEIEIRTSLKSYLYRMGYNLFLNGLRKKKKQASLLEELKLDALQEEEQRPEEELGEAVERLKKIIETLPARCQEILKLKMQGHKYQEIAESLDISVKTVEAQMRLAYIKIREGFGDGLFLVMLMGGR
ncbi:RNA polymerase sigma-70 factor [Aequorivita sp. H23M31]|uniref:RNA polymerase sigma factor SigS n=1 Tax=Aequorivita ciconiae TaxID=2494375 RepID=A0A410G454_9FLAO|nr:RNA polymerase sigma-70 factor [Aequorivita sp. H23M31]QAA82050.1 RNA polymerase sigma-70 factor [Aequorivita sp. H23M31]